MRKSVASVFAIAMSVATMAALTACAGGSADVTEETTVQAASEVTITFMNQDTTLGTVTAEAGAVLDASSYEAYQTVDGYDFGGWYETPSYLEASLMDLASATFTEDTTLYGLFSGGEVSEDTNSWYIVGTSSSGPLATTNWAAAISDEEKANFELVKSADSNEFTITIDLYAGDQFQLIPNWGWDGQIGWGYVATYDETQVENGGGLSGSDKTSNVNVLADGNYTITLTTNPDDTNQDAVSIVRNGDVAGEAVAVEEETYAVSDSTGVKVKGSWVADWSEYKDLEKVSDGVFSITMDVAAGTELYFSVFDGDTDTGLGFKGANVTDDASKALLEDADNVKVAADGTYTFTVDVNAETITVTQ